MVTGHFEQRALGRIGTVLKDKYRLDELLGVGGMAVVYRATHRNQAEFAIKMLHPELSFNADIRARFLREGYAANSVKHPGVVLVVDDDVAEDGAAFLVMELLTGMACDKLAARCGGRLPIDAACAVALELLDVLVAAHAKGIVHRDIKPPNLFVTRDAVLKVLDFGIARVRDSISTGAQATHTGMVLGTPAFMSPEQALGKASEIDFRSDLWAVGATVFTLASGAMVHEAETGPQLLVKLATEPARSLAVAVPAAPGAIVEVIDRALLSDKARRWPSASAMRSALDSACRDAFGALAPRAALARTMGLTDHSAGPLVTAGAAPSRESAIETSEPVSRDKPDVPTKRSTRLVGKAVLAVGVLLAVTGIAVALRHARTPDPARASGPAKGAAPPIAEIPEFYAASSVSAIASAAPPSASASPPPPPIQPADVRLRTDAAPQRPAKRQEARPPQEATVSAKAAMQPPPAKAVAAAPPPASAAPAVTATTELLDGRH